MRDSYDAFERQLETFIAAVEEGTSPPVTAQYGRELVLF